MNGVQNTYQITGEELVEICEAIQDKGYYLASLESDGNVMSIVLKKKNKKDIVMNFLR